MTKEIFERANQIMNEKEKVSRLIDVFKNASGENWKIAAIDYYGDVANEEHLPDDIKDTIVHLLFTKMDDLQKEFEKL